MIFSSDAARGVCIMILAAGVMSMNDAVSKYLVESYPIGQILCLRQVVALLVILLYVWRSGGWQDLPDQRSRRSCVTRDPPCWWCSADRLGARQLADRNRDRDRFLVPIVVLIFSMHLLGERVSWFRWIAVLIGFAGVLAIIRPGGVDFRWVLLIPVAAAVVSGLRDVMTRRLSRTDTSISLLFWSSTLMVAVALFTIPLGWRALTVTACAWLLVNGLLNAGAHFLMIEALRLGDAGLVSPFRYTAILWATVAGVLVWQEVPGAMTMVGAALLVVSGILIIRRGS